MYVSKLTEKAVFNQVHDHMAANGVYSMFGLKVKFNSNFWLRNANWLQIIVLAYQLSWPSGLRRWFKAPVSSEGWVRVLQLPSLIFCCVGKLS